MSRFALRTRARGALTGIELRIDGGELRDVHDIGAPEGTTIEVRDLFYNLPARRKFLKADSAEAAQVSRLMTQLALGAPTIGFQLASGGRKLLDCPPAGDVAERFYQIYQARPDLVEVRREGGGMRVHGYIAPLAEQGPRRGPQNIYVNGRIVRDKTIAHAIQAAYAVATVKERSPEVHLFIEMPPERVDVNVHPTKAEVRFLEQGLVHEVLRRALTDALGAGPSPELRLQAPVAPIALPAMPMLPGVLRPDPSFHQERWRPVPAGRHATRRAAGAAGRHDGDASLRGTAQRRSTASPRRGERRPRDRSPRVTHGRTGRCAAADRRRHPADEAAGAVPAHVHPRRRPGRPGNRRPARGARARALRAHLRAADARAASRANGC